MEVAAVAYIYIHYALTSKQKRRKSRRSWQTHLYTQRNSENFGSLVSELKFQAVSGHYKNFTRITPSDFEYLLNQIGKKIQKQDTVLRKAISAQDRLALTIRFLATGDSYSSLQYLFRISKQSISGIIPEVCQALIDVLKENIKVSKKIFFICIHFIKDNIVTKINMYSTYIKTLKTHQYKNTHKMFSSRK